MMIDWDSEALKSLAGKSDLIRKDRAPPDEPAQYAPGTKGAGQTSVERQAIRLEASL